LSGSPGAAGEANRDALVSFIRASTEAIDWLFDPKNRTEAGGDLQDASAERAEDAARRHVDALLGEREGFTRGGALDPQG